MSRISSGTMTVAIFALLMGLAGAYTVRQYLNRPEPAPAAETPRPPQTIPLASVDLMPGKTLAMGDMVLVPLTPELRKKTKITSDAMVNTRQLIGRVLKEPVKKGEPFISGALYLEGMGPNVAERLKSGFRAVAIPVDNLGSVAGFAGPGSFVDVIFRTNPRGNVPEATLTLLQKVEVLAFGEATLPGVKTDTKIKSYQATVTLAVSPAQANALKLVEGQGEMSLALRGADDDSLLADGTLPTLTLHQLLGITSMAPTSMEIYRGGSRQTLVFDKQRVVQEQFGGINNVTDAGTPPNATSSAFPPPRSIQAPGTYRNFNAATQN